MQKSVQRELRPFGEPSENLPRINNGMQESNIALDSLADI